MKKQLIIRSFLLVLISLSFGTMTFAQKAKKNTTRLKINYVKIMDTEVFFDIGASSRVNKKNVNLTNIDLTIYNVLDDETILLGKIIQLKDFFEFFNRHNQSSLNYKIRL